MDTPHKILVVDDDVINFDVIEGHLTDENYELHYVNSGEKSLDCLDDLQPDLILMDVMMPRLNGMETCKLIRANKNWSMIPILMVTALNEKKDLADCLNAGANDYIAKPVSGLELRARVRSLLRTKEQQDEIKDLLQLRQDMVNMIVHDLRTPLTTILLTTEIMQSTEFSFDDPAIGLEKISLAGQQIGSMVDSLLYMAKLESSHIPLNFQATDLHKLCAQVIRDFEPLANQKGVSLLYQLDPQLEEQDSALYGQVDTGIFRRVLDNLLSNAIKFTTFKTQVILYLSQAQNQEIKIAILDCGRGISPEKRDLIFQKFEVGDYVQQVNQVGLGLAFCKMAVERHGGRIWVEDNQPQGSIFTLTLPPCSAPDLMVA